MGLVHSGKPLGLPRFSGQGPLERTRSLMNAHVRDALVDGHQPLIPALELPDPGDRHVLAAAIKCGADLILAFNLDDFPEHALASYGIGACHPDLFLVDQLNLDAEWVCTLCPIAAATTLGGRSQITWARWA